MTKQKIAFIKHSSFSHINIKVIETLQEKFPNFEIEIIDIYQNLISKKDPLSLFYCLKEFGIDILLRKRKINAATYLQLPYVLNKIKQKINQRFAKNKPLFTFQTQSLFDASIPGVPHFVYTDHTYLASRQSPGFQPQDLPSKALFKYEKSIYQNATLNFTMSFNVAQSIIDDYECEPDKVACVYCGSNLLVEQDKSFDERRFSQQNILFVGVQWERKGGPILVEAFKRVLQKYPNATLTIVGCEPELDVPNCNVVGRIPLEEVKQYFRQASIFCLPTRLEPFGIVFLEAMAHKLPVIASNIGAIPEIIIEGKNGYLVEPDNSQQLSEKILELIDSPEKCKAFGEYGHEIFGNRYTWSKTGLRIKEKIEQHIYKSS